MPCFVDLFFYTRMFPMLVCRDKNIPDPAKIGSSSCAVQPPNNPLGEKFMFINSKMRLAGVKSLVGF